MLQCYFMLFVGSLAVVLVFLFFTLNIFAPFSSVSSADFEQVNASASDYPIVMRCFILITTKKSDDQVNQFYHLLHDFRNLSIKKFYNYRWNEHLERVN